MPGALSYGSLSWAGFEHRQHDSCRHDRHERCHEIRSNCTHGMSHTAEVQRNADGRSDRHPHENAEPVNEHGKEAAPRVSGHDLMLLTHHRPDWPGRYPGHGHPKATTQTDEDR